MLEKIYIFNLVPDPNSFPTTTHLSGSPALGFGQVVCFHLTLIKALTPFLKVKCIPSLDPAETGLAKRHHFKYVFGEKKLQSVLVFLSESQEVLEEMTRLESEVILTLMRSGNMEDP